MRITHHQLRRLIRETLLTETRPTFDLRTGDIVRHRDEGWRGSGRVVAKGSARDRVVLVLWDDGSQQRHDPSFLIKEGMLGERTISW
jgi:hypothetical protein